MKNTLRNFFMLTLVTATMARADILIDFTDSLTLSDPTQMGRLSRNGVAQDWTEDEPFSGVINTTTTYHYTTYAIFVGVTTFLQIDVDSPSANTFVSAYDTSYEPDSGGTNLGFDTNWLGDAGSSGNFFGVDPIFFQVIAPADSELILVVNNTGTSNLGVGDPYHITVEGYLDSEYTSTSPTPEPSSLLACLGALSALVAGRAWKRSRVGATQSLA